MDQSVKDDIKDEPSEISEMSSDESTDTISHSPILSPMSISPVGSPVHEVPLPSGDTLQSSSQSDSASSLVKQWLETCDTSLESDEDTRPSKILKSDLKSGKHGIPTPKFPQPTAPVLTTPQARSVLCRIGLTPQGRMVPIRVPPEPVRAAQEPIRAPQEPFRVPLVPIRRRMPLQPVTTPTPRLPVFKRPFPQRFIPPPSMRTPQLPAFYTAIPEDNVLEEFSVREKKVCDESRKGRLKYTANLLINSGRKNKTESLDPPKDYILLGAHPKEIPAGKKRKPQYTISSVSPDFPCSEIRNSSESCRDSSYDRQSKKKMVSFQQAFENNAWFSDHSKDKSGNHTRNAKFEDTVIDLTLDCLDETVIDLTSDCSGDTIIGLTLDCSGDTIIDLTLDCSDEAVIDLTSDCSDETVIDLTSNCFDETESSTSYMQELKKLSELCSKNSAEMDSTATERKEKESILLDSDMKNKSKSSAPPKDYTSLGARPKEKTVFTKKKMSPQYTISSDSLSFSHFKVRDNSDGSYDRQKKSVSTWFPDHSKGASGKFDDLVIDLTSDCLDKPKPNTKSMDEALKITELCSQISSEVDISIIERRKKESACASSSRGDTMFKHNLKESEGSYTKIFDIASTSKDDAWFKIHLIEPEGLSTSKGRKQSKEMDHAVPSTSRDNTWFKQNIKLSQHLYTEIGQKQQDSAIPSTSKDDAWLQHGGKGSQIQPKQIVCDPVMKDYETLSTPKDVTWLLPPHNLEELELEREPHIFTVAELSSALHDIEHLISAETKPTGKMFKGKSKSRVYRKLKTDPDITLSLKKDCTSLADTATECSEEDIEKSIGFVKPAQDIESKFSIREKSTWFKDTAETPSVKIISVVDVKPTGLKTTVKKDFQIPSTSKGYTSDGTNLPPMMTSKKKRKHEESDNSKDDKKDKDYTVKSSEIERKISNKVLEGCTDAEINKLLNFDSLKDAYKFITDIETRKDRKRPRPKKPVAHLPNFPWLPPLDSTNMSHSDIAQLKILMDQAGQIFASCWFRNCKFSQPKLGCSQCYLTYCNIHISKMVHGCGFEPFDKPSTVKKIGAAYASAKVKTMGREIERGRLSPASCNCKKLCSKCTFYYAYINMFAPFATAVNETAYQQYALPVYDMDTNGNGKRGTPKLRDIMRRQRQDSDAGGTDSPDLDFIYDDTDTAANEIAELYSYTEQPEFQLNVKAFEDQMEQYNFPPCWQKLAVDGQKSVVMKLLDQLEISNKVLRMRAARCILYICQGCWAEVQSDTEQQEWAHRNSLLLYELGVFNAFTDLLNIEIENSAAAHVAMRKLAVSLADSQDLRVILSVLYTITEAIRNEKLSDSLEHKSKVDSFKNEIVNATGDDLLVIKLLSMVTRFCSGAAPHFPMKKVLLLLWKLILVSLGGMEELRQMKAEKREKIGLSPLDEDTMEIAKNMRASSPPASASDLLEMQNQKRNIRMFRKGLTKQSSLDDHDALTIILETSTMVIGEEIMKELSECEERRPVENSDRQMYGEYQQRPMTPPIQLPTSRGLPWKPKVRQRDIDLFLKNARMKFIGYVLQEDRDSLAGLPQPIHEGVRTLKEHMYISLADLQIEKEEEIARNPLSCKEEEIEMTPTEVLYQAMLPNLPQYMIALLKILLAAAPTSKAKTDSINIMSDVLPEEMPMTVVQSMKLGLDVNRHKEIIVKAVSAILLLLLKHFKLNHVCQFDFMSQHLVFANCIPLVLKFFNQNVMSFVSAINMIPILDFPACVIGDQPELTAESLEIGYAAPYSWRNIYSCINLLRILNKLTKWKHSRIMMLVVFKSAPILKRTLKVRHAMTQLYVLKLLKMQTKYLGRQWRKSNMKTISAIYAKVRHHLNDDWAFGNDLDARPWDFQGEECALRASVDRFNNRRYTTNTKDADYEPVDNCLNSVLGTQHDLSESFKKHYNLWLEQEVYNVSIDWDKLLLN